jgi:hypothetical protein
VLPVFAGASAAGANGDEPRPVAAARATAPMITLTGHPRAITRGRTTTIPFWAHGHPRAVVCRLDGGQTHPCQSPLRMRSLAYGRHELRVRALNARGDVTVTIRWTVLHQPAWKVVSTPVYVTPPELAPPGADA